MKNTSHYQNLLNQWNQLTQQPKREVALEDPSLQYIARPVEQIEEIPQEEIIPADTTPIDVPISEPTTVESLPLEDNVDISQNEPVPIELNQIPTSETSAPKEPSQYEKLMNDYLAAKDTYSKDVKDAYEKDRKSQMVQKLIQDFGKALTYSGFAGAKTMSGPLPLDMKTMDMKYAEEAKESGKAKLDTYRELISQLRSNKGSGVSSSIQDFGDKKVLITYTPEGQVLNTQELGKKALNEYQKETLKLKESSEESKQQRWEGSTELRKEKQSLDKEKFEFDKIQKDELTPKQVEVINGMDTTLDSLDKLEGMKTFSTGPIQGRIQAVKRFLGTADGNKTALAAQLRIILSQYGKAISGSAIAEPEMKRLEQQLPQETDSDEQFAAKLANFQDEVNNSRVRIIDTIKKSGRNVENFEKRQSLEELKSEYTPAQEKAINLVMEKNEVDRATAIKALQRAGKL